MFYEHGDLFNFFKVYGFNLKGLNYKNLFKNNVKL